MQNANAYIHKLKWYNMITLVKHNTKAVG